MAELDASPAARLARIGFVNARYRDAAGIPRLPAEFVAEQGRLVRILDLREPDELVGLLGHIPDATNVPMRALATVADVLAPETLIVLVSNTGHRAGTAATYLEALGMLHVAALDGGIASWKRLGFSTSRAATWRKELRALPPGVGRDGRPLSARRDTPLGKQDLRNHAADAGALRWIRLAAFANNGRRSCVDGRDETGVIGTPGGDMGELMLALACVESIRGSVLTDAEVRDVLIAHIDAFGRFYMHTDIHAMNQLIVEGYRKDPRIAPHLAGIFEALEWRAFHKCVPVALREAVLEHLLDPKHMGCGHLRQAMTDEGRYGVRPELARSLLRAFHETRWAGAPELEWVVLGGEHNEGAVVEVTVGGELHGYTRIPLVSPLVEGVQVFVAHPEVITYLRRETASFLVERGLVSDDRRAALLAEINARGARQLAATLQKLAGGLPVLQMAFRGEVAEITEAGFVPKG